MSSRFGIAYSYNTHLVLTHIISPEKSRKVYKWLGLVLPPTNASEKISSPINWLGIVNPLHKFPNDSMCALYYSGVPNLGDGPT